MTSEGKKVHYVHITVTMSTMAYNDDFVVDSPAEFGLQSRRTEFRSLSGIVRVYW